MEIILFDRFMQFVLIVVYYVRHWEWCCTRYVSFYIVSIMFVSKTSWFCFQEGVLWWYRGRTKAYR